ncbi:BrnT family toxin [Sessilibacter corallicola]|uniref:BrnT family toxin n=1 Tax=Sessilibacter corallicola TaxID=2904075 RepID=A0ABQ0A9Q6_9GAMM
MKFEWDVNKNSGNISKHGIDFRSAVKVFNDPNFILSEDNSQEYDEVRYQIIGVVDPYGVLLVVYTERHEDVIRLISARKATSHEKRIYRQFI